MVLSGNANELYEEIAFLRPGDFYNQKAPKPVVAFVLGGAFSLLTLIYWIHARNPAWRDARRDPHHSKLMTFRTLLATIADNDDPAFTILRVAAQSFLLLGGFQLDFQLTFLIMLGYYAIISMSDSIRVFLALLEADYLQDLVVVSKRDKAFLLDSLKMITSERSALSLQSGNVYENISRNFFVVIMVFVTQVILISFVVIDVYAHERMTTFDGTSGVPILGTLGSWLIYVLGIFMQNVYLLGPKTSFGTSEQNPHFWLTLLLAAKKTGAKCKYYDAVEDEERIIDLRPSDFRLWIRFCMSFLINGVGFHILVHALPIQVAGQSGLTGIVFRAVGMLYLVDLDDAPGTVLKLVESNPEEKPGKPDEAETDHLDAVSTGSVTNHSPTATSNPFAGAAAGADDQGSTAKQSAAVLERARLQAELLQKQLQKDLQKIAENHEHVATVGIGPSSENNLNTEAGAVPAEFNGDPSSAENLNDADDLGAGV